MDLTVGSPVIGVASAVAVTTVIVNSTVKSAVGSEQSADSEVTITAALDVKSVPIYKIFST
jgi:hypothetical protein